MAIKVLESQVTHVSDALHWLDASTRHMNGKARTINELFDIEISRDTAQTARLRAIQKPGMLVLHHPDRGLSFPQTPGADAITTEEQRSRPDQPPFALKVVILHPSGRYNPRRISLDIGSGKGHGVWLYPALHSRHRSPRALFGTLAFEDHQPARWALLTLTVGYAPPDKTITLYTQADDHGDFELSLLGLPALAKGISHFSATLTVTAEVLGQYDIPDPDAFSAAKIAVGKDDDDELDFKDMLAFALYPDQRTRLSSPDSTLLFISQSDD